MAGFLKGRPAEVLKAVGPLIVAVCILQFMFVQAPVALFLQFLGGSTLAIIGMVLLFAGIDLGILPMGRFIGPPPPCARAMWWCATTAWRFPACASSTPMPRV